jgi:hypothetical protein
MVQPVKPKIDSFDMFFTALEHLLIGADDPQAKIAELTGLHPSAMKREKINRSAMTLEFCETVSNTLGYELADFLAMGRALIKKGRPERRLIRPEWELADRPDGRYGFNYELIIRDVMDGNLKSIMTIPLHVPYEYPLDKDGNQDYLEDHDQSRVSALRWALALIHRIYDEAQTISSNDEEYARVIGVNMSTFNRLRRW